MLSWWPPTAHPVRATRTGSFRERTIIADSPKDSNGVGPAHSPSGAGANAPDARPVTTPPTHELSVLFPDPSGAQPSTIALSCAGGRNSWRTPEPDMLLDRRRCLCMNEQWDRLRSAAEERRACCAPRQTRTVRTPVCTLRHACTAASTRQAVDALDATRRSTATLECQRGRHVAASVAIPVGRRHDRHAVGIGDSEVQSARRLP